ncbi:MAG: hypothetical protein IIB04_01425 [Acidobacteria bacterium]|nr:hypothetical protein [Acidobacteriota bacterium]
MQQPTRQEQAQAILERRARRGASAALGRRAVTAADVEAAKEIVAEAYGIEADQVRISVDL